MKWWFDKVYPCISITVFILTYILILAYAYVYSSIHIDFHVSTLCSSIHVDFYVPITYTCIFSVYMHMHVHMYLRMSMHVIIQQPYIFETKTYTVTWCLQMCTWVQADNPGPMEEVCMLNNRGVAPVPGCQWQMYRRCQGPRPTYMCDPVSKIPLFPYIYRGWENQIKPIGGVYIPIIRIPIKGWSSLSPNIGSLELATYAEYCCICLCISSRLKTQQVRPSVRACDVFGPF